MDRLPDDALLEVLLWLPPEDLLACRLVCKRLGTLAMHPHVWRRKCCSVSAASCACPVLRLAPCLGLLQVTLPLKNCLHLYTTRCAVSRLDLLVDKYMKDAALIIHRQSFLLRLKSVTVTLGQYRVGQYLTFDAGVAILFTTLASTCGLTYLKVRAEFGSGLSFDMTQSLQSIAVPSSIKTFIFEVGHALSQTYIVRRAALWALALLSVLPRLPALQELSLDWHTDELLRGINPTTAPALRILSLHCGAVRPCTPGPAHRDAFKSLFSANPSVKVKVTRSCTRCL
ncbi:uncharacterized protein LOC113206979 isoform X2 [Frankliniella occidentalis]|uniref:Uncharacterized protein LOC113206979 isoform X2 n=1 Tax=Frankliniella occidentalis TaxID=133901 RepID=A0A9C6WLD8_FRAOC|nr:uncharacterized protein LOC113206979 isoform X2 [Frankliniella occidentalis]